MYGTCWNRRVSAMIQSKESNVHERYFGLGVLRVGSRSGLVGVTGIGLRDVGWLDIMLRFGS